MMVRSTLVVICLALLQRAQVAAAPDLVSSDAAEAPQLTATFECLLITADHSSKRERFTVAREPRRIAYSFGEHIDVWSRTAASQRLLRVFPAEKTAVEYSEGQLRALGDVRSWQLLTSLLPQHPARLGLRPHGTGTFMQRKTLRFGGQLHAAQVSIEWLEREQLPAILRRKSARAEQVTTLKKLTAARSELDLQHYRRIDASDLGDLAHDAFVQRHSALLHSAN